MDQTPMIARAMRAARIGTHPAAQVVLKDGAGTVRLTLTMADDEWLPAIERDGSLTLKIVERDGLTRATLEGVTEIHYTKNDVEPARVYKGGRLTPWSSHAARLFSFAEWRDNRKAA